MEAFGYPAWWTPPQSERKAAQAPVALPFQSGNVDAGRRACRKLLARDTGSPGGTGQENVADASWRSPRGSPASFSSAIPTASPFRSLACSDADVYDGAQALMALRNTPSPSLAPASSPPHPSRPAPPPASSPLDTPTKIAKTSSPTSTSPLVSSTPTSSLVVSVSQCAVQMRSLGKKRYLIRPAPRIVVRHEAEDTCGGMYVRAELVQGDDEQVCERALDGDVIEVPLSSALSTEVTFSRLCCMIMPKKLQQNGKLRLKFTLHCNCHNTAARQSPIPHAWCLSSPFRLFSNYGQMTAHQRTEFMQSSSRPRSALASPLALPPAPLPLPPSPSTPSSTLLSPAHSTRKRRRVNLSQSFDLYHSDDD